MTDCETVGYVYLSVRLSIPSIDSSSSSRQVTADRRYRSTAAGASAAYHLQLPALSSNGAAARRSQQQMQAVSR